MSIDAITYAKTLDVDNPMSRLLLFIIAENTFNDTGECKVGQSVLAYETRAHERTVRRHLDKLGDEKVINVKVRPRAEGGRLNDAIELVGFLDWLRQTRTKPEPDNLAGSEPQAEPDKNAEPDNPEPDNRWPVPNKDNSPVLNSPVPSPLAPEGGELVPDHQEAKTSFEAFWAAYPRKVSKVKARQQFEKICKDGIATGAQMVAAAKVYAASVRGREQRHIKHPTRWLTQECWLDEPSPRVRYDAGPTVINAYSMRIEPGMSSWDAWTRYWRETGQRYEANYWTEQGYALVPSQFPPVHTEGAAA
jgi:hypothetical protein